MKISAHIFHSPIENESRLMKETSSLLKLKIVDKVLIFGAGKPNLERFSIVHENCLIYRSPIVRIPKFLSKIKFFIRISAVFNFFLFHCYIIYKISFSKPTYISCHNLVLLPLSKWCKIVTGASFIYEPHELETERTGLSGKLKSFSKWIENRYVYSADKVLTVCKPIEDWYRSKYGLNNVYTLRNVPSNPFLKDELVKTNLLRDVFNIPDEHIIFIYQGVLDPARGVVEIVNLFKSTTKNKHLVLMGYGSSVEWIIENCDVNIHYQPAVPVDKIIEYTSSADLGIFFINTQVTLSYQWCLPNKFFEYLIAGLPVIVSDNLTYLSDIINENELGWSIPTNSNELKQLVDTISKDDIEELENKVSTYSKQNGWQFEESQLLNLYASF